MLRNFLITSLRILWRNKVVSAINILSLSIGITAFILILLYVHHENSYDKFNENYDRIYRLEGDDYVRLSPAIADHIRDRIPEIDKQVLIQTSKETQSRAFYDYSEKQNESIGIRANTIMADNSILDIFTFSFSKGNPKTALIEPYSAVLTESMATKLFGDADPIGKTIAYDNNINDSLLYRVNGVINDLTRSHIKFDVLLSNNFHNRWIHYATYLLLKPGSDPDLVEEKINLVMKEMDLLQSSFTQISRFHLRPMSDLYLNGPSSTMLYGEQGDEKLLWSFMTIGVFVLILAIINYVNLTTARGTLRSKEVILKKLMGSGKGLLRFQFIGESVLFSLISFLLALTSIQLLLPTFNALVSVDIQLADYNAPGYWFSIMAALLLTGLISGIYPAILLTSFQSVANIKDKSFSGIRGARLRQSMLTLQFCISIVLIIGIITNLQQLNFAKSMELGFIRDQVLLTDTPRGYDQSETDRKVLREKLLAYPAVKNLSFYGGPPIGQQGVGFTTVFETDTITFTYKIIDPDYLDVMGIELLEGRNFSYDRKSDMSSKATGYVWLVNETTVRKYFSESPVGKRFNVPTSGKIYPVEIIGVFSDVHYQSTRHEVEPMFFIWIPYSQMAIKISSTDISQTVNTIRSEFESVYGDVPFLYSFLDEEFNVLYKSDERAVSIVGYFTALAIFIACMGLFGLSSFMAVRRTKEIGIRKALGASANTIFVMLSREYIKWILLSAIIASPIAWFAMNKWLESFAYRIELGPGVFVIATVLALAIGLITVGWQALKSAVANPVDALRYE